MISHSPILLQDALQRRSKVLTRGGDHAACMPALSSSAGGTVSRFNRYDERCRRQRKNQPLFVAPARLPVPQAQKALPPSRDLHLASCLSNALACLTLTSVL